MNKIEEPKNPPNRIPQWLLEEWDYEKNHIEPEHFTYGSNAKIWWKCYKNHSWNQIIRYRKKTCPYCQNKKLWSGFNDLYTKNPEIINEWDYTKNLSNPKQILYSSSSLAWWKCERYEHKWQARINARTSKKNPTNCPYCSNKKVLREFNDIQSTHPELLKEWDYERNIIKPYETILYTKKVFHWKCQLGHSYSMSGEKKILKQQCSYCVNKKVLPGFNDLLSQRKDLIQEWDYEKNKQLPQNIYYKSSKKFWWKCETESHTWQASLANRVNKGSNCPHCSQRVSKGEIELRLTIQKIFKTKHIISNNRTLIKPYEIDIYLPDYGYAFEYNGDYWHSSKTLFNSHNMNSYEYHSLKSELSFSSNLQMFFVWQNDWENDKEQIVKALYELRDKNTISDILIKKVGIKG